MSGLNSQWAVEQLDDFIRATGVTFVQSPPNSIGFHSYRTAQPEEEIVKRAQVVEQILTRVIPGWIDSIKLKDRQKWSIHHEASIRAREALIRADEVRKNLGDDAPEISAAKLHPWVWSGAASLWQSGHFRSAVDDAAKKLNAETQNKVGRRDVSETDLFKQAFSLDAPTSGKARLRRMKNDGSDTYKSMQRGAWALAEGIYAGIRNPFNHEDPKDIDAQAGLEYLAAMSVLARWVDDAKVEVAS